MRIVNHLKRIIAICICLGAVFLSYPAFPDEYDDIARATGGTVKRMTKGEFKREVESGQNRYRMASNAQPLFMANCSPPKKYVIPMDSEIAQSVFELTVISGKAGYYIISPSGVRLKPNRGSGDARQPVEIVVDGRKVVLVPSPEPGRWRLEVTGTGKCALSVRGQTRLGIVTLGVVRAGGRPGHEGYFPYDGPLTPGDRETVEVSVGGADASNVAVSLVGEDGKVFGRAEAAGPAGNTAYMSFMVPGKPFRMLVTGSDAKGFVFERLGDRLYTLD